MLVGMGQAGTCRDSFQLPRGRLEGIFLLDTSEGALSQFLRYETSKERDDKASMGRGREVSKDKPSSVGLPKVVPPGWEGAGGEHGMGTGLEGQRLARLHEKQASSPPTLPP